MEKLFSKTESKYLSTLFQKEKKLETDVCISENSLFEIHKFPLSPVEISTRGYRKNIISAAINLVESPWWPPTKKDTWCFMRI